MREGGRGVGGREGVPEMGRNQVTESTVSVVYAEVMLEGFVVDVRTDYVAVLVRLVWVARCEALFGPVRETHSVLKTSILFLLYFSFDASSGGW